VSDEEFSPRFAAIEDLDPEPRPTGARAHRPERLLGLALLLGLVLFAGGQWWIEQSQMTAYRAGLRAAAAHDWDTAARRFADAGGYADGAARAADARHAVDVRAVQYAAAVNATAAGDSLRALAALRNLAPIAPEYRDVPTRTRAAEAAIYRDALAGAVARRGVGPSAGLYGYTASGWSRLAGSDGASEVRAACANGSVVYDAPRTGAAVPPITPPARSGAGPAPRHIVLARPGDPAHELLREPVGEDGDGLYQCAGDDLWGVTKIGGPPSGASQVALRRIPLAPETPAPPDPPGPDWPIINVSPDGRRLLILDMTEVRHGGSHLFLYIRDTAGGEPQLLGVWQARNAHSSFSPDGRYALLSTYAPQDTRTATRTVTLIDTQTGAGRVLSSSPTDAGEEAGVIAYGVTFVRSGPRAGQAILGERVPGGLRVRLLDPARPEAPLVDTTMPGADTGMFFFANADSGDGALALVWPAGRGSTTGAALYIDPAGHAAVVRLPPDPNRPLWDLWVRGDRLIFNNQVTIGESVRLGFASARLADLEQTLLPTASLFEGDTTDDQAPSRFLFPAWSLGAHAFAYTTPTGELHARSYDGAVDLRLEAGHVELYNLAFYQSLPVLR
jgi:hypothetical protein